MFAALRAARPTPLVVEVAREFSPRLQRYGSSCVVCDVSGLGRLLGEPAAIGAELVRTAAERISRSEARASGPPERIITTGIHIAIAPTITAALLLTLAYDALSVVVDDPAPALAPLPLVHLQQLVVETQGATLLRAASTRSGQDAARKRFERAFDMARRWGLTTIGELAALPAGELSARMGQDGVLFQQLAVGKDPGPLVPDPDIPRLVGRMELEWPIDTLEPLSFVLARLLDPLSVSLERADQGAAALRLDLRLVDRTVHRRVLQLPAAMRDSRVLRTLLLLDLESRPPSAAIDIVSIEIDPAPGRVIQYSLLERALPSAETLATLNARLDALVGEARCGAAILLDTHRPDGFELRRFELREAVPEIPVGGQGTASSGSLSPGLRPVLRRFRPPVAVRVSVARGRPTQIAIDRRGMPGGIVDRCAGPWRTSGAWWDPAPWDRDEWDVALQDGTVCRLYCERETGTWFLEGVLD